MKILISDQLEQSCIDILTSEGFTVDNRPGLSAPDLLKTIEAYDALLVRSATKVTAEVIAAGKNLRVIGRAGTGVDNIDARAATRRGIIVMNTPGGNTVSAAEHTVSMMLSLARNIPQAHMSLHAGEWRGSGSRGPRSREDRRRHRPREDRQGGCGALQGAGDERDRL